MEQPRRPTLADHVHRPAQLGTWVLIRGRWYQSGVRLSLFPNTPKPPRTPARSQGTEPLLASVGIFWGDIGAGIDHAFVDRFATRSISVNRPACDQLAATVDKSCVNRRTPWPSPIAPAHPVQSAAKLSPHEPDDASLERAKSVVTAYFASWSGSGTNVENLAEYYGATTVIYGTAEPREKIMAEKRKFFNSLADTRLRCRARDPGSAMQRNLLVSGTVEWDVSSPSRGAHPLGAATFQFTIALNASPTGGILLSENGAVISAHNDATISDQPPALPATSEFAVRSPAYAAGRQARIHYEARLNTLPAGNYRVGAEFWAENRSLEHHHHVSSRTRSCSGSRDVLPHGSICRQSTHGATPSRILGRDGIVFDVESPFYATPENHHPPCFSDSEPLQYPVQTLDRAP